jgi:hypothetical protein
MQTVLIRSFLIECCFVFGIVEQTRSDIYKLCQAYRRPAFADSASIGIWQTVLESLSVISVLTNFAYLAMYVCQQHVDLVISSSAIVGVKVGGEAGVSALLAYFAPYCANITASSASSPSSSAQALAASCDALDLAFQIGLVVLAEHAVLGLKYLLAALIPDVPEHISAAIARDEYLRSKPHEEHRYFQQADESVSVENGASPTQTVHQMESISPCSPGSALSAPLARSRARSRSPAPNRTS